MSAWDTEDGRRAEAILREAGLLEWPAFAAGETESLVREGIYWAFHFRDDGEADSCYAQFVVPRLAYAILNDAATRFCISHGQCQFQARLGDADLARSLICDVLLTGDKA